MFEKKPHTINEGVLIYTEISTEFEKHYLNLRKREQRILSDEEVAQLPNVTSDHVHFAEWDLRQKTLNRFSKYLMGNSSFKSILDVGCGNGWFTNYLCRANDRCETVVGLDINLLELQQARRVFSKEKIQFAYADIVSQNDLFEKCSFDLITFNASIQYFADPTALLRELKNCLNLQGEIHILDSPFYEENKVSAARERSAVYFDQNGSSEMATFYHHHSLDDFSEFEILYKPNRSFLSKALRKNDSPFPWLKYRSKVAP